jgi:hypothetical protein
MRTFLACTFALIVSVLSGSMAQARAYDYGGGYRHAVMWHYAYRSRPIYRRHYAHRYSHRISHRYGRHLARRHFRHLSQHVGRHVYYDRGQIVAHPAGCPRSLFCGCGASIEVFGRSVRDLWLVANWYRFPRTAPAPGMAVLWGTRHVAIIREYYGDGTALLYDTNSGQGLTRVHRRSIAGLAVVNPHPGKKAKLISWASTSPL